jgi:hypothetical protein
MKLATLPRTGAEAAAFVLPEPPRNPAYDLKKNTAS